MAGRLRNLGHKRAAPFPRTKFRKARDQTKARQRHRVRKGHG